MNAVPDLDTPSYKVIGAQLCYGLAGRIINGVWVENCQPVMYDGHLGRLPPKGQTSPLLPGHPLPKKQEITRRQRLKRRRTIKKFGKKK